MLKDSKVCSFYERYDISGIYDTVMKACQIYTVSFKVAIARKKRQSETEIKKRQRDNEKKIQMEKDHMTERQSNRESENYIDRETEKQKNIAIEKQKTW